MMKRIITRPDFDGVICAVLLKAAVGSHLTILWVQPSDIQNGKIDVGPADILANLPMYGDNPLWFDHHVSNESEKPYRGLFRVAPSAAGLIYEYYQNKIAPRFQTLVQQADKIDDAQLNIDEILYPEKYPYILLSMTIDAKQPSDLIYCNKLVEYLRTRSIEEILNDLQVRQRCDKVLLENKVYEKHLLEHTQTKKHVSITDFRELGPVPNGNRFLIYSLFPDSVVNIKIFHEGSKTIIKLGHSIVNRKCQVNVGKLLSEFGGGGHRGAGACRVDSHHAEPIINKIINTLIANKPTKK